MEKVNENFDKAKRSTYILAMINLGIWAISIIAMIFLIQDAPIVKNIFPILGGGIAVGIALIAAISKVEMFRR